MRCWLLHSCTCVILDGKEVHPDAKGLRNKHFPHYNDLYSIFGKNRGIQKGDSADKVLEGVEESNNPGQLIRGNACKGIEIANGKVVRTESGGRRTIVCEKIDNNVRTLLVADVSNGGYKGRLEEVGIGLLELEEGRNLVENVVYESDDVDDAEGSQMNIEDGSSSKIRTNRKRRHSDGSYEYQVVKILETFLKRYEEQFNLLCGHVGQQAAVDKATAEKRQNLNGELMKLPNLSLQEWLRAATRIICDPSKIDLFYSLNG